MAEQSVVNASPLIFLSKAGLMHLFQVSGAEVIVPEPVAQEILKRGSKDITAQAVADTPWLKIVDPPNVPGLIQIWDLGLGESSVLAYAYFHPGVTAVIDDEAGRNCAETLGLPLMGTLGMVMTAKKRGLISAARPVVALLKQHGMYLAEKTIDQAMMLVDE